MLRGLVDGIAVAGACMEVCGGPALVQHERGCAQAQRRECGDSASGDERRGQADTAVAQPVMAVAPALFARSVKV
jgi:hypothetical protein